MEFTHLNLQTPFAVSDFAQWPYHAKKVCSAASPSPGNQNVTVPSSEKRVGKKSSHTFPFPVWKWENKFAHLCGKGRISVSPLVISLAILAWLEPYLYGLQANGSENNINTDIIGFLWELNGFYKKPLEPHLAQSKQSVSCYKIVFYSVHLTDLWIISYCFSVTSLVDCSNNPFRKGKEVSLVWHFVESKIE